ncbi:MAG: SDR family NAD(P)-dependent oxidoreductase [Actinomycetota bacterium]
MTRRILVTGAGRGIGLGLIRRLVADGHEVFGTARSDSGLAAARDAGAAAVFELDLEHDDSIAACAAAVAETTDSLDTLINNAGLNSAALGGDRSKQGPFEAQKEIVLKQIEINAMGPMLFTQRLQPLLHAGTEPIVLNLSSQLGSMVVGGKMARDVGYNSSKSVMNMVTVMSATVDPQVGYVAIHPGWVQSDMGGEAAAVSVADSVDGLVTVLDGLTVADSGRFLTWEGNEHPW